MTGVTRLRRSDPSRAGDRRVRSGRGFRYLDASGEPIKDAETLARFKSLVIPPAWSEVWICPWPNGHIQAIGTDDAGRRQYLYHPSFRAAQEEAKHEHVLEVAARLPAVRGSVAEDLADRGLGRRRVLGCAARLLDLGLFRVGSERYVESNGSYGLTTLLCEHACVRRGDVVEFRYHGKSGRDLTIEVADPDVHRAVRALRRGRDPHERLLVYRDGRELRELHADDLNGYLRELFGTEVSAKDFRTWHATVLAAVALAVSTEAEQVSAAARRRAEARAVREVADYLGNTPAVCRASYINPRVFELYEQGRTIAAGLGDLGRDTSIGQPATHGRVETAVRRLLGGGEG